ncbi:50S ribosomal protein L17 [bacterium]|nr:50S ribosomal protein L17 [bacterium]
MRHRKNKTKLNRTTAHKKALMRNLAKELIKHESISTTKEKAKELKKVFEPLVTLAKSDSLHARRLVLKELGLHNNSLTPKEARKAKAGDTSAYNIDRLILDKLFKELGPRYKERPGGYTRIVLGSKRVGDDAQTCFIECV